jgi:hypothetical protein
MYRKRIKLNYTTVQQLDPRSTAVTEGAHNYLRPATHPTCRSIAMLHYHCCVPSADLVLAYCCTTLNRVFAAPT